MKLEIGKRYLRRDGSISGIIVPDPQPTDIFKFFDGRYFYTEDGSIGLRDGEGMSGDIIAEYTPPTPHPRIIQLLLTPNDAQWQGTLLGLGDDGVTYREYRGEWKTFVPAL